MLKYLYNEDLGKMKVMELTLFKKKKFNKM